MKTPTETLNARSLLRFKKAALALSVATVLTTISATAADTASGTLYYTTFSGGVNVHKVDYNFNGTSLSLSGNTGIAAINGADGIVFTSDKDLAIGGQGDHVNKVDPTTGNVLGIPSSGGISPFHMMARPDGTIWSSGIPGTPASYNSTLTVNGTAHLLNGADTAIDTLAWTGSDVNHAFYTSSSAGGGGNFGRIDLSTGTTTRLQTGLAAAHGMTYDPYSGTLVLFGANHITQIDPITGAVVSDLSLSGTYDQGTVDGKGHIFAANNDGDLTFLDITSTKLIGSADYSTTLFLANSLDDVAPLVGAGSQSLPDSLGFLPTALCLGGVCFFGARRWKRANAL